MSEPVLDLVLLQALRLKGRLNEEAASRLAGEHAWPRLGELQADGFVSAAPVGVRLTPAGREHLAALIAAERATVDTRALRALYEERFDDVNHALKAVVTAWQMKPSGTPNEHADADYDAAVLARLASVHGAARPALEDLGRLVPRLAPYAARLGHALVQVQAGDAQFLAHPLKDSYHQVWFELHEELLALLGLSRAEEARAGRA